MLYYGTIECYKIQWSFIYTALPKTATTPYIVVKKITHLQLTSILQCSIEYYTIPHYGRTHAVTRSTLSVSYMHCTVSYSYEISTLYIL